MEKNSDNLLNLFNLPTEIQQHIAAYLDAPALSFFAQSHKQTLKAVLPSLLKFKTMYPLRLTAKVGSTYLTQANQLFMCGYNEYGQLGLGDNEPRFTFTAVPWPAEQGRIQQVIAGGAHTLVLTQDNRLWVCGLNNNGQLGLGDKEPRATFTAVPWSAERGCIRQVIVGANHTVVLTQANRLWVCGYNAFGQLGLGDKEPRATFTAVPWPEDRGRIQQVIADGTHTLVLTQNNRLWVCGANDSGQLGLGDKEPRATFTAVPWPEDRGRIQQVIAGNNHTVVLTQDNRLWVCGFNFFGQLGLGDKEPRANFTTVPWPENHGRIHQIIAGDNHTVVLIQDNQLWACGDNGCGQLGLGDQAPRATFTPVNMKKLSPALQEIFMSNNHLNQLIKLGQSITLALGTEMSTLHSKRQPDELDGQPPLKKMRL